VLSSTLSDMTAQQISLKMKQELPMLVQPSQTDKAIVELYEDALHLAMCQPH